MPEITFSLHGIQAHGNFQVNKASGPDHTATSNAYILNNFAEEISPVLKVMFTELFTTGTLPTDWLTTNT